MSLILVIHHDADLYGADKSLLRAVRALKQDGRTPVIVVPHEGPLLPLLQAEGIEVHIGPVGKLTRQLLRPTALPRLLGNLVATVRFLDKVTDGRPVDLVYINSIAAVGGGLWARLRGVRRLWHVREIVVSPALAATGFPWLLSRLGGWCVCNSGATQAWLTGRRPELKDRSSVVWNGIDDVVAPAPQAVQQLRAKLGLDSAHTVVTLVGRLNRWKGQGVLIQAAALLQQQPRHRNTRYLIVGDVADGQHHFRDAMLAQIRQAGQEGVVLWQPFTRDVDTVWAASDVAVVPSIEPEPFGRVAIEAMAHGLPVIAARHGGLTEIVLDEHSGLLVEPGSAAGLASAIDRLVQDPALRRQMGAAGRERQRAVFSQAEHDRQLLALFARLTGAPANYSTSPPLGHEST